MMACATNKYDSDRELFENPIHPLLIHIVPPYVNVTNSSELRRFMEMEGHLREIDHFVRTSANKHPSLALQIRLTNYTGRKHLPIPQEDRFNERRQKMERNECV